MVEILAAVTRMITTIATKMAMAVITTMMTTRVVVCIGANI